MTHQHRTGGTGQAPGQQLHRDRHHGGTEHGDREDKQPSALQRPGARPYVPLDEQRKSGTEQHGNTHDAAGSPITGALLARHLADSSCRNPLLTHEHRGLQSTSMHAQKKLLPQFGAFHECSGNKLRRPAQRSCGMTRVGMSIAQPECRSVSQ